MVLRSARLLGDPVLEQCLAGTHRMLAPEENLSVMRVQECLKTLGFLNGALDGIFGPQTGSAVSAFKQFHSLSPTDPVVGPGTSGRLDSELFFDPPNLDPSFGEVASFVAREVVEPFVGFELAPLINAPLSSQRRDVGSFMLSALNSGHLICIVASTRAAKVLQDPRIPPDIRAAIQLGLGPASGRTQPFIGTDGRPHVTVIIGDTTIRGRRSLVHRPSGRKVKIELRGTLCHELTHVRNDGLGLQNTPTFDTETFLDPVLAESLTQATGHHTARVFNQFAMEMNARHSDWIIERELAGDPFAARFLQPVALSEAAQFYFAETDPVFLYDDNGYIQQILARGHAAKYRQIALWLRQTAKMTFSAHPDTQQISARLFRDAADSAEFTALNPGLARPPGDGIFPGATDFR
jgi:hypothetical protein